MLAKKDVDILSTVNDNTFDADDVFDASDGFAFAIAFTAYNSDPEPVLRPEYGEIVFNHYTWGPNEDGIYVTERRKIPSHVCTEEEMNFDNDYANPLFLPIYATSVGEVKTHKRKLMCADREDYMLYGDYGTFKASQFNVQFIKCNQETNPGIECESEEEITRFIRDKWIFLLYN